jgi:hypothetical protein
VHRCETYVVYCYSSPRHTVCHGDKVRCIFLFVLLIIQQGRSRSATVSVAYIATLLGTRWLICDNVKDAIGDSLDIVKVFYGFLYKNIFCFFMCPYSRCIFVTYVSIVNAHVSFNGPLHFMLLCLEKRVVGVWLNQTTTSRPSCNSMQKMVFSIDSGRSCRPWVRMFTVHLGKLSI